VLIALAILALALPILLGLRNFDLDLHARALEITDATILAQEKLAETELSPTFPLGEVGGDFLAVPFGALLSADALNRSERFRWKRIITSTPLPTVREVKIQVLWPGRGLDQPDEMVEVSTYVVSSSTF
jgi:general secretion pathway protein I